MPSTGDPPASGLFLSQSEVLCPVQSVFVTTLLGRGTVTVEIVHLHGADSCWGSRRAFITGEGGEGLSEKVFEVSLVNERVIS